MYRFLCCFFRYSTSITTTKSSFKGELLYLDLMTVLDLRSLKRPLSVDGNYVIN